VRIFISSFGGMSLGLRWVLRFGCVLATLGRSGIGWYGHKATRKGFFSFSRLEPSQRAELAQ